MQLPIYLDYSATTPVDPRVVDAMVPWLRDRFGNPASRSHAFGWDAEKAVENARANVAALVNCDPRELIWTSGATESINLALKGAAHFNREKGKHLVTVKTEHKATLDTMRELEREGFEVTYMDVEPNGLLDLAKLEASLRPDTILVSVMFVNNEIGVIQDIPAIGELCRARGIIFHVDAAQATGKCVIDLAQLKVDLMSFSAHKTYGPKGVGALFVRRQPRVRLEAQMHGGGHERGLRSGTLATHQIVGMGECYRLAGEEMAAEIPRLKALRDRIHDALTALPGVVVNGSMERRVASNLNVSLALAHCDGLATSLTDVAVSATSACSSGGAAPSHVLQALGRDDALAGNALRISVGRFNTDEEVDFAIGYLRDRIDACRRQPRAGMQP